jgi:hypothetical protein
MAKNLVNGTNIVVEENGDNINMNLSSTYTSSLNNQITSLNNEIDTKTTYSATETVIGTWLGKPIYRKVIQYNKTSNGQVDLSLSSYGITNVENIWLNQNSFIKTNDNEWKAVNTYESDTYFTFCTFRSTNSFRLSSNSGYARGLWNLIIEYTKTTD